MRIYERYFARQIYLAFIFILFAFSGLFFFFDLINELNTVGHGNYKFGMRCCAWRCKRLRASTKSFRSRR